MPLLWRDSVDAHRHAVRESVLDAAGAIYTEAGPTGLTMSAVAERAGIGRGTLYRYFPDTRELLLAWHERQVRGHLDQLREVRDRATDPASALRDVLEAYARLSSRHEAGELPASLHANDHMADANGELHALLCDLLTDAAREGQVRLDVEVGDLATYCVHAVRATAHLTAPDADRTVAALVIDALRPNGTPERSHRGGDELRR